MQLTQHVWYVAYGSNLCESRFMAYINGSDGSTWPKAVGCRDKTPPLRDISGEIPGSIYFAEHGLCQRKRVGERLAHTDCLRPLPRKRECCCHGNPRK